MTNHTREGSETKQYWNPRTGRYETLETAIRNGRRERAIAFNHMMRRLTGRRQSPELKRLVPAFVAADQGEG